MVCPRCGFQNSGQGTYCAQCGTMIAKKTTKRKITPMVIILICVAIAGGCIGAIAQFALHKHNWIRATCLEPMTCLECGETAGQTLAHKWVEASCSEPKHCTECGLTEGDRLAHTLTNATCTEPGKCTECGAVVAEAIGHLWEEATLNDPAICTQCGQTQGSPKKPTTLYYLKNMIKYADASSVYAGDWMGVHHAGLLYDGDLETNWTEDASGFGIGEYVVFYFNSTYAIKELDIWIGCKDYYRENGRPRIITLTFSDGSEVQITLSDTEKKQTVALDQYYYTDSVMLTIDAVYEGTKYIDTVISEIDFTAYSCDGIESGGNTTTWSDSSGKADGTVTVTDAYMTTSEKYYGQTNCFHIPKVQISGVNCDEINQKMYDEFSDVVNRRRYLHYTWAQSNGIISIVAESNYMDWEDPAYYVYNISAETGRELTLTEFLKDYGLTVEEFYSQVRNALEIYWDGRKDISNSFGEDLYDSLVKWTLEEDNVRTAIPYVNKNGQLCFVVRIASPAGASSYPTLVNVSGKVEKDYTDCSVDH